MLIFWGSVTELHVVFTVRFLVIQYGMAFTLC